MSNLFENAKFGDKFRTRDGRMAIFLQKYKVSEFRYEFAIEDYDEGRRFYLCKEDGSFFHKECGEDIIGKWQEEIKEEELDKLAEVLYPDYPLPFGEYESCEDLRDAFKIGCHRAKDIAYWKGAKDQRQIDIDKACELYAEELRLFCVLLEFVKKESSGVINKESSINSFRKKLEL